MKRWNKKHIAITRSRIEKFVLYDLINRMSPKQRCLPQWSWEWLSNNVMLMCDCSNRQSYFILVAETP